MPRLTGLRKIEAFPSVGCFMPVRPGAQELEPVEIKIEEWEAMRLKNLEGLNQEECAQRMHVSRQTFQNVIDSARRNTTLALTEGRPIRIVGGNYTTGQCIFTCLQCGADYEIRYTKDRSVCPRCGAGQVICKKRAEICKGWCQSSDPPKSGSEPP